MPCSHWPLLCIKAIVHTLLHRLWRYLKNKQEVSNHMVNLLKFFEYYDVCNINIKYWVANGNIMQDKGQVICASTKYHMHAMNHILKFLKRSLHLGEEFIKESDDRTLKGLLMLIEVEERLIVSLN